MSTTLTPTTTTIYIHEPAAPRLVAQCVAGEVWLYQSTPHGPRYLAAFSPSANGWRMYDGALPIGTPLSAALAAVAAVTER